MLVTLTVETVSSVVPMANVTTPDLMLFARVTRSALEGEATGASGIVGKCSGKSEGKGRLTAVKDGRLVAGYRRHEAAGSRKQEMVALLFSEQGNKQYKTVC